MSLSGHKDTDMLILLQLEDHELGPVCQANSYVRKICQDENFWKMRVVNMFKKSYDGNIEYQKRPFTNFIKDVNPGNMEALKKYFGFDTMKELNRYLGQIPLNALFQLFIMLLLKPDYLSRKITFTDELPKYINKNEIIFEDRRDIWKQYLTKDSNYILYFPRLYLADDTPGIISENPLSQVQSVDIHDSMKSLKRFGIKVEF